MKVKVISNHVYYCLKNNSLFQNTNDEKNSASYVPLLLTNRAKKLVKLRVVKKNGEKLYYRFESHYRRIFSYCPINFPHKTAPNDTEPHETSQSTSINCLIYQITHTPISGLRTFHRVKDKNAAREPGGRDPLHSSTNKLHALVIW